MDPTRLRHFHESPITIILNRYAIDGILFDTCSNGIAAIETLLEFMRSLAGKQEERSKILGKCHLIRIRVPFLRGEIVMSHSPSPSRGAFVALHSNLLLLKELGRHYLAIFFYWRS